MRAHAPTLLDALLSRYAPKWITETARCARPAAAQSRMLATFMQPHFCGAKYRSFVVASAAFCRPATDNGFCNPFYSHDGVTLKAAPEPLARERRSST